MTRGGKVAIAVTVVFYAACVAVACAIDWHGLTDLPLW